MRVSMKYVIVMLSLCVWCAGGCGYHLPGRGDAIPADVEKVFVEVLINRTTQPFIENKLTSEVRDQFSRRPGFEVVSERSKSDAVISGTITQYSKRAVAYDQNDDIKEYRAAMTAEFRFERTDGSEVFWQGDVRWDEEFMAHDDRAQQDNNETEAQNELTFRLATELFNRIVDNF